MRHVVVRCLVAAALLVGVGLAWANSTGPPANRTNAFAIGAFPVEPNCTQCHAGNPLDDPNGKLEILDLPRIYAPGQTYSMRVRLSYALADTVGTSNPKWGFELTAVRADSGLRAGTLVIPPGASLLLKVPTTGLFVNSKRQYIQHNATSTFTDSAGPVEWNFDWVAPDTAEGKIYFFATGNAANGNGSTAGDLIFTAIDSMEAAVPGDAPMAVHRLGLRLEAPRPNPASRGTSLAFTLPRAGHVTMVVFDASGRRLRTVLDGEYAAGNGQARWDTDDESGAPVPAGAYFARLALDGRDAVTRKITVAR